MHYEYSVHLFSRKLSSRWCLCLLACILATLLVATAVAAALIAAFNKSQTTSTGKKTHKCFSIITI